MKVVTPSPEMEDVAGADNVRILITQAPCGVFYSTEFFDDQGKLLRQDQHLIPNKMPALFSEATPPVFGSA